MTNHTYIPILSVRPAEMTALQELPEKDKDRMLPFISLRGWLGSNEFDKTIERIKKAIDKRPFIADIDLEYLEEHKNNNEPREAIKFLRSLKQPDNNYHNWVEFIKSEQQIIPCLQLESIASLQGQLHSLSELNRGVAVRLTQNTLPRMTEILSQISSEHVETVFIVIDYGRYDSGLMNEVGVATTVSEAISILPTATIAISSTSFPSAFNIERQDIGERTLFNKVKELVKNVNPEVAMVYSDRGSVRFEKLSSRSRPPLPRVDYPLQNEWLFFREVDYYEDNVAGYCEAARKIISDSRWEDLHIWGTEMIKDASRDDVQAINYPRRATAVRINIHLHQQTWYDSPDGLSDTDDDYTDD